MRELHFADESLLEAGIIERVSVRDVRCDEILTQGGGSGTGPEAIDATCPLVTKVHHEARRFAREDREILLIGHAGHEEVEGTTGRRRRTSPWSSRPEDVDALEVRDPSRLAWLSQTTLSVDETLRDRRPAAGEVPAADRPAERRHLLRHPEPAGRGQADRRPLRPGHRGRLGQLVQLRPPGRGRAGGRRQGLLPGGQRRRDRRAWLEGVSSSASPAGASVPDDLVQGVLDFLVERGFPAAREERLTEESLVFALPPELRRDLKRGVAGD